MKPIPVEDYSARCIEAMEALYGPPMSEDEITHYNTLRAAEMCRAQARRMADSQPDLLDKPA